jgi:hypothetical protein
MPVRVPQRSIPEYLIQLAVQSMTYREHPQALRSLAEMRFSNDKRLAVL